MPQHRGDLLDHEGAGELLRPAQAAEYHQPRNIDRRGFPLKGAQRPVATPRRGPTLALVRRYAFSLGIGFMTASTAPVGSATIPKRPMPGMSSGPIGIVAPSLRARAIVASG